MTKIFTAALATLVIIGSGAAFASDNGRTDKERALTDCQRIATASGNPEAYRACDRLDPAFASTTNAYQNVTGSVDGVIVQ